MAIATKNHTKISGKYSEDLNILMPDDRNTLSIVMKRKAFRTFRPLLIFRNLVKKLSVFRDRRGC